MSWDSRNVSAASWLCSAGALTLDFSRSGGGLATCGEEVLQIPAQAMPTIRVVDRVLTASRYTILMVDRDAPSAQGPIRSPLRHMLLTGIPQAALAAGVSSPSEAASAYTPYAGPQPPAGSLCHRYYVQVYSEAEGVAPQALDASTSRFLWNFTQYAHNSSLTLLFGAHFRTQNASARVTDCDGGPLGPTAAAAAASSPAPLIAGVLVPLLLLLAGAGVYCLRARSTRAAHSTSASEWHANQEAPYGKIEEKYNPTAAAAAKRPATV